MNFYIVFLIFLRGVFSIKTNFNRYSFTFINRFSNYGLSSQKHLPSISKHNEYKISSLNNSNSLNDYEPVPYKDGLLTHLDPRNFKFKGVKLTDNVVPLNDNVLLVRSEFSETTKSGVYVGSQNNSRHVGCVLAVGPGRLNKTTGEVIPVHVAVGDTVIFDNPSETLDLKYNDKECVLVKEDKIFARIKLSRESLDKTVTYDKIVPLSDRLLLRVLESPKKTQSGLVLTRTNDNDDLVKGVVVSVGPGSYSENGKLNPVKDLKVGDVVLYNEKTQDGGSFTSDNINYSFVRPEAVLAKL